MEEEVVKKTTEAIGRILKEGIATTNIDNLYKLSKIKNLAKEDEKMNYNYNEGYREYEGRGPSRGAYGEYYRDYNEGYNNYERRGRDMKYRGYGHLDRMYDEYNRYEANRERYGADENTKKSLKYMLQSMEDFARMLKEDAKSQEEVQMIRETAQRIANM